MLNRHIRSHERIRLVRLASVMAQYITLAGVVLYALNVSCNNTSGLYVEILESIHQEEKQRRTEVETGYIVMRNMSQ